MNTTIYNNKIIALLVETLRNQEIPDNIVDQNKKFCEEIMKIKEENERSKNEI